MSMNGEGAVYVQTNEAENSVIAFRRGADGALEELGASPVSRSVGNGRSEICWAVATKDGRFAFTTNFADGAVSRYAVAADGVADQRGRRPGGRPLRRRCRVGRVLGGAAGRPGARPLRAPARELAGRLVVPRLDAGQMHLDAMLPSVSDVSITLEIDEGLLRHVDARASRTGRNRSEVVEQALRCHLGLDALERLWQSGDMPETDATELALEAQHATRRQP